MQNQVNIAKSLAKQLGAALTASGQAMAHSNLLEVVAKAYGARTWHAFLADQKDEQKKAAPIAEWTPEQGPMPQALFVQRAATSVCYACPACGSKDVEWEDHRALGSTCVETATCNACPAKWAVDYAVSGYRELTSGGVALSATSTLADIEQWLRACEVDDSQLESEVGNAVAEADPDTSESEEAMLERLEWEINYINNGGLPAQLECLFKSFNGDVLKFIDYLKKVLGLEQYSPKN